MESSTDYRIPSPHQCTESDARPSLGPTVWLRQPQDLNSNNLLGQPPESRKHALPSPAETDVRAHDRLDRPFKFAQYPPPSYSQTREAAFPFSDAPRTELAPIKSISGIDGNGGNQAKDKLPSLLSITSTTSVEPSAPSHHFDPSSPSSSQRPPEAPPPVTHWPSLNPLTAYYTPSHIENPEPPLQMDMDTSPGNTSGVSPSSTSPPDLFQNGRSSSVSLDDPDVRMAAEALGALRADFVSSPGHKPSPPVSPQSLSVSQQPEPLLSLLTTSHPFLATTLDNAASAYENSKNYSSRIKTSIEYVEGYVIPIANTVGTVGRKTGVENGVRWFLRRSRPRGEIEGDGQGSTKRRKFGPSDDHYTSLTPGDGSGAQTRRVSLDFSRDRQLSIGSTVDTLPAYDDFRSPPYSERLMGPDDRTNAVTWHSRLIMSTSGLSIAMSEESLRRLKYCLSWIRWANVHIGNAVTSLTITMEKYERRGIGNDGDSHMQDGSSADETEDRSQLAAKVRLLRSDVVKTLRDVTNTISRYAGGALPENARALVRRHLTSLPQRLHLASLANKRETREAREADTRSDPRMEDGNSEQKREDEADKKTRESAQLVLVIAREGLDMMSQVSLILKGTIESAEEWCERLGKGQKEKREDMPEAPQTRPEVPEVLFADQKTG